MSVRLSEPEARIKVRESSTEMVRSGGENRPLDYPHLYQIQAGDWRISYAVEQNHLAILVLEVLNPDGTVRKDPARETLTRKMKVKLLDWPEGSPSRDLPPEDLGKKVKIKLLDMADELDREEGPSRSRGSRVKLKDPEPRSERRRNVTLLKPTPREGARVGDRDDDSTSQGEVVEGAKVTPLNSPTM